MYLLVAILVSAAAAVPPSNTTENNDFSTSDYNYFDFTRQWSPNSCYRASHHCKQLPQSINYWTIHGLWPSKDATHYPSDCAKSCHFNSTAVSDLLPEMHDHWPTDYTGGDTKFWTHEYCKHGTCCTDVLPSEHDYFSEALKLNQQYGMDEALASAGITPSVTQSYTFTQLNSAMEKAFGVGHVSTWCRYVKEGGASKQLMFQLSLCISRAMQPMDCPTGGHESCNFEKPFYLLPWSVLREE